MPHDWLLNLLKRAFNSMLLGLIDGLMALIIRMGFFSTTELGQTVNDGTVTTLHNACLGIAGALLGALLLGGAYGVMARGVGLSDLTLAQLLARLLVAVAAMVTARPFWIGWTIELNNAICRQIGEISGYQAGSGLRALVPLLGLDEARERSLLENAGRVGSELSKLLQDAFFNPLAGHSPLANQPTVQTSAVVTLLLLLLCLLVLLLGLQLLLRLLFLNLLIVIAPLMLALFVLPTTARWAGLWLRWFFPTVFLQAFQLAILTLSHGWLGQSYGVAVGRPDLALLPILLTLSALYLTLKAPGLLDVAYGSALSSAASYRGAARDAAGAVGQARRLVTPFRGR